MLESDEDTLLNAQVFSLKNVLYANFNASCLGNHEAGKIIMFGCIIMLIIICINYYEKCAVVVENGEGDMLT